MKVRTKRVALAGVFIALSIIFTRFLSRTFPIAGMPALRLSFGDLPLIISGITLGPVYGAFTGVLADLLGYPLNPLGAYFPGFTLSAALSGFLPGLMAKAFNKKWTWVSLALTILITQTITSLILNTLWLSIMGGQALVVLLPPRIIAALILMPVYVVIIKLFLKHVYHTIKI